MHGKERGREALRELADAALFVLKRRVQHAPPERHEERFLPGWQKRLNTYAAAP